VRTVYAAPIITGHQQQHLTAGAISNDVHTASDRVLDLAAAGHAAATAMHHQPARYISSPFAAIATAAATSASARTPIASVDSFDADEGISIICLLPLHTGALNADALCH